MNMCLLEVAICEKCRSSHFQSEGGKGLMTGGLKDFRSGGHNQFFFGGGGSGARVILLGRSVPHYMT